MLTLDLVLPQIRTTSGLPVFEKTESFKISVGEQISYETEERRPHQEPRQFTPLYILETC